MAGELNVRFGAHFLCVHNGASCKNYGVMSWLSGMSACYVSGRFFRVLVCGLFVYFQPSVLSFTFTSS